MDRSSGTVPRKAGATDNYSTPMWAIDALLDREEFLGPVLEPAAGQGNIVRAVRARGLRVVGEDIRYRRDINDDGFCAVHLNRYGVDFLRVWWEGPEWPSIITNPPYSKALAFAQRALVLSKHKVALLLRLKFLESARRYDFLKQSPLKHVYVFSSRLAMWPEGWDQKTRPAGVITFAWFVWEHGYNGEPTIRWIPPGERERWEKVYAERI